MQLISIQQLVIDSLATLSNDLHNKVDQTLSQLETQQSQTIDSLIQKQLALMLPNLYPTAVNASQSADRPEDPATQPSKSQTT